MLRFQRFQEVAHWHIVLPNMDSILEFAGLQNTFELEKVSPKQRLKTTASKTFGSLSFLPLHNQKPETLQKFQPRPAM
jgi:hypothetical protein